MWPITGMPGLDDRRHARDHRAGALELDDVGAGLLDEADRVLDRLLVGDLERAERHVADDDRPARAARPCASGTSISSIVTGTVVPSWPRTTIAAVSPTRMMSTPASSANRRAGRVVGGDHHDLLAARASSRRARAAAACPAGGVSLTVVLSFQRDVVDQAGAADADGGGEDGRVEAARPRRSRRRGPSSSVARALVRVARSRARAAGRAPRSRSSGER